MANIFIFPHFGLNIPFFILCNFKRICLYNREIILAALLRQNSKINMTKNREIVIFLKKIVMRYFCHIAQPYFDC